jgi:hypothetical protein
VLSIRGIVYDSLEIRASPGWTREVGILKKASGFRGFCVCHDLSFGGANAMREAVLLQIKEVD